VPRPSPRTTWRVACLPLCVALLLTAAGQVDAAGQATVGSADALPADRLPVLLLDLSSDQRLSPAALGELEGALGRGLGRTDRYALTPAPQALRGLGLRACFERDCLRRAVGRPAGYLLRARVEILDKDYTFRLRLMDSADPGTTQEVAGSCDICSFAEACQALEDLSALVRLRTPAERRDPPAATGTPARPPASPPGPAVAPGGEPSTGQPPSPEPPPGSALSAAPPESSALVPQPRPAGTASRPPRPPRAPAAGPVPLADAQPAVRPKGWMLSGGSVGHNSRAVGWGIVGAGFGTALTGGGMVNAGSAGGAVVGALGLAAMGVGFVVSILGDRPPPFAAAEPSLGAAPAPPASAWVPAPLPTPTHAAGVTLHF